MVSPRQSSGGLSPDDDERCAVIPSWQLEELERRDTADAIERDATIPWDDAVRHVRDRFRRE